MSREGPGDHVVLDRVYEGTTNTLRIARNDVVECLVAHAADQDVRDRAELVASELATNAIQASPGAAYGVRVSFDGDGSVVMAVTSSSETDMPPPREAWGPVTAVAPRGRGLLIVGKLTDAVDIKQPTVGTIVVTATFRAQPSG